MKHLLIGLLLTGVALFSSATQHYPPEAHSTRDTTTVRVFWVANFQEANLACSYLSVESPADNTILACYYPPLRLIVAVEPTSFNDQYRLMILGHEFWHALGAMHPAK